MTNVKELLIKNLGEVGGGKKLSVGKAARSLVLAPLLERKAEGETGQAQALIPSPGERTGNGSRGHLCGVDGAR